MINIARSITLVNENINDKKEMIELLIFDTKLCGSIDHATSNKASPIYCGDKRPAREIPRDSESMKYPHREMRKKKQS